MLFRSDLRDLFGARIAFAATTREASVMVLGQLDQPGADTLPIGPAYAGLCLALVEGERVAVLGRVDWLSHDRARTLAVETASLRPTLDLPTTSTAGVMLPARVWQPPKPDAVGEGDRVKVLEALAVGALTAPAVGRVCAIGDDRARRALNQLADTGVVVRVNGSTWALTR